MQGFPAPVLLQSDCKEKRNDSVGLRIPCADRKKVYHSQAKTPSPEAVLHGFLPATVRVLNSYSFPYKIVFVKTKRRHCQTNPPANAGGNIHSAASLLYFITYTLKCFLTEIILPMKPMPIPSPTPTGSRIWNTWDTSKN